MLFGNIYGLVSKKSEIINIQKDRNYIFFTILGLALMIMALDIFPFEKLPKLFTMMQFSFRLLEFAGFFLITVSAILLGLMFKNFNMYTTIFLGAISLLCLLPSLGQIPTGKEYYLEQKLEEGISLNAKTGRVHAGMASLEYLPSRAFENKEYIINRKDEPIILSGNGKIETYKKQGTNLNIYISTENSLKIELPYIYYIGYRAEAEYENGKIEKLDIYESENRIFMYGCKNKL